MSAHAACLCVSPAYLLSFRRQHPLQVARKASARFNDGSDALTEVADALGGGPASVGGGSSLSASEVDAMDASALRKLLLVKGLPASGKLEKLRSRVKEVYSL